MLGSSLAISELFMFLRDLDLVLSGTEQPRFWQRQLVGVSRRGNVLVVQSAVGAAVDAGRPSAEQDVTVGSGLNGLHQLEEALDATLRQAATQFRSFP